MMDSGQIIGTTIDGKYRIDRLIDRGGMGAIYAATHVNLNRTVAVKLIRTDLLSHPTSIARFKREARMAARVEHPHAVTVYDFGSIDGIGAYLAMEFIQGESLRSLLARRGPLPLAEVVEIATQVASVLGAAHRHGIVHRDVKPANILLRNQDDRFVVKLTDFGIAKSVRAEETTQLTSPSELVGTPSYMAPEQFSGDDIDGRTDLYALGAVVYEMLSGHCPFEGTLSEVIGKHLFAEPPHLPEAGASDPLAVFLVRVMAKAPEDRPATAVDFIRELADAAALRAEITGEPVELSENTIEIEGPLCETERVPLEVVREANSFATAAPASSASIAAIADATADDAEHAESDAVTSHLPTVFVPASPIEQSEPPTCRVVILDEETTQIRRRPLFGRRASAMAAGVVLTALLIVGANSGSTDGVAAPVTPVRPVPVEPVAPAPVEKPATENAERASTAAAENQRARTTRVVRKSKGSKPRSSRNGFVRILRVDKQIVKIFRG
jgi:serine/threonine protein kinase